MANLYEIIKGKKGSVGDFILDRFSHRQETMLDLHRSWLLNLAWVRGYQNTDFDLSTKKWQTSNFQNPWKPRLVTNLMLPIVRRNVSQLVHTSGVWDVTPATVDDEDISISRLSTKTLLHYWDLLNMPQQLIRVAFWQSICSSAFFKVGWDADVGDEIAIETKNIEQENLSRFMEISGFEQAPELINLPKGDAYVDIVSPFNMTFDDNAAIMEDSPWSIESNLKGKDWIVNKYGNKHKGLTETSEQELFLYPYIHGERTGKLPKKGVLIHEFFVDKCKKFKKGLHAVIVGDGTVLETPKDLPYDHGEKPYSHFLEIYDPGSLWGTNTAEQVRPQQARYNRVSSGILENINLNSNIQWLNPRQSGVKQITNKPGQVMRYNAPHKPEQSQPRPLPSYIDNFLNRTRLDMQDTASNHDVSEAKAEPGVRSGRAVLALQDADDSIKGPVMLWFDRALAKTGRLLIQTLAQNVTEDRMIDVQGTFTELETLQFSGAALIGKSKGDYFKVRVKTYGRQPLSRSAREGMVRTLIELQLLSPAIHREELLHILGAADVLSIYDQNSNDRVRQRKEIELLIQGQEVGVYFGQNHDAHMNTVKRFIASSDWDKLEPEKKQVISLHMQYHLQQQTIEMIYQQAYAQGLIGNAGQGDSGKQQGSAAGSSAGGRTEETRKRSQEQRA